MKRLLKMLALWLIKILNLNLVEPYTLEHLKNMIYSVKEDYSKFKYKPFLVKIVVVSFNTNSKNHLEFKAPFLIDCPTKDDALKIVRNIQNSLSLKRFATAFNDEKDIYEITASDISAKIELQKAIAEDSKSQYFLEIDLLSGTTKVTEKTISLPVSVDGRIGNRLNSAKIAISNFDFDQES